MPRKVIVSRQVAKHKYARAVQSATGEHCAFARPRSRAAFADLLEQPQDDFRKAAESVLQKNKELYQKFGKALDAANRKYGNALRRLGE